VRWKHDRSDLAEQLLQDALRRCARAAQTMELYAVEVRGVTYRFHEVYFRYGFTSLEPSRAYLPSQRYRRRSPPLSSSLPEARVLASLWLSARSITGRERCGQSSERCALDRHHLPASRAAQRPRCCLYQCSVSHLLLKQRFREDFRPKDHSTPGGIGRGATTEHVTLRGRCSRISSMALHLLVRGHPACLVRLPRLRQPRSFFAAAPF
jgi:hypothetical protein